MSAQIEKVALVTGAGSGIGKSAALGLMAAGFHVVLAGRRKGPLQEVLSAGDQRGEALVCDVSDAESVAQMFKTIEAKHGRLDLLFNNAGVFVAGSSIDEMPLEDWHRALDINLTGCVLCARAAFGLMRRQSPQGGRMINNGSISAHAPRPNSVPYTVTKHAITGLTKCLSLDGRAYDIACSQIDIGNAATPLAEDLLAKKTVDEPDSMPEPMMSLDHVTEAVVRIAQMPLEANVQFMTIMATKMPYLGRG